MTPLSKCATMIFCLVLSIGSASSALAVEAASDLSIRMATDDLNASFVFPVTPVNQSYAACVELCFSNTDGGPCNPALSGSIGLGRLPAFPFRADDFTLIPVGNPCSTNGGIPVSLPVFVNPGQKVAFNLNFSPNRAGVFRDTLELDTSTSDVHLEISGATPGRQGCSSSSRSLCLASERFQVTARWTLPDGRSGDARMVRLTPDTGYMWFFNEANVEAMVKVIDGCGLNDRFWVFAGGLTNVRVVITVLDLGTGAVKTYTNPQGQPFQPIQDTSAFSCRSGRRTRG